ncbi:hypothetical protein Dimus_001516 [Dionaea muscipula]
MMASHAIEADAISILRAITPTLDPTRHKGQAGKVAVIGGCREYTGAPYFAAISALKIGADLSHVFCTKDAAPIIKGYSPELIVHPVLEESYGVRDEDKPSLSSKVLSEVQKWMERFDCIVIGPGLGRDPLLLDCVSKIMKHARQLNIPIVIDGDGLFLVTNNTDLVSGYPLAVLTPNVNEYKRLVQKVLNCEVNDQDAPGELLSLVKGKIVTGDGGGGIDGGGGCCSWIAGDARWSMLQMDRWRCSMARSDGDARWPPPLSMARSNLMEMLDGHHRCHSWRCSMARSDLKPIGYNI